MKKQENKINRRSFLKKTGASALIPTLSGVEAVFGSEKEPNKPIGSGSKEDKKPQKPTHQKIPTRKLGKTGIEVPALVLGAAFDIPQDQIILRRAIQSGLTYWDTAHVYRNGNSELGIGQFLSKNPELRKQLFIATKASGAKTPGEVEERLQTSFKRMNTNYIDLYYGVHAMSDPAQLTDEIKQWAQDAKKRKLIRFFGFTNHSNTAQCLMAASKLDWIDAIMTTYNFRLMQDTELQAAIDACHKAGIALIAMKVQGHRQKNIETEQDKKLTQHFIQRGFTQGQAKTKAVFADERFSSLCIGMSSVAVLTSNIEAVLDKKKLSEADTATLKEYAEVTRNTYCAGCSRICNSALPETPCISEIMRYLMYYNSYGQRERATALFAQIPASMRERLRGNDYSIAEAKCPNHLPIARLVKEAVAKLA
ncbi:MAG: aldo/keto reductase [Sedimentisphaerales bacterium]|nr:aldo/keto reductase [Sedimentisphaerales bacterium]